jgi:hypothetical protein
MLESDIRLSGPTRGQRGARAASHIAVAVLASLALAGCSIPLAELPSLGGSDPATAKDADGYMAVNLTPAQRPEKVLQPEERTKVENELIAARERQAAAAAAAAAAGTATAQ